MTTKHSKIGASSASRWLNCPGSVELNKKVPNVKSKYAAEGSAAHELCEIYLKAGAEVDETHLGTTRMVEGFEIEVTEEMLEAVASFVSRIREDAKACGATLWVERSFNLVALHPDAFGTADAVIIDPLEGEFTVYDYKHGKGVAVPVVDNPQLIYYALGVYFSLSETQRSYIQKVRTVIIQPRMAQEEYWHQEHSYTVEELLNWLETFKAGVARVFAPNAETKAGSWCRFCSAKAICPTVYDNIQKQTELDFKDVLNGEKPPPPHEVTPEFLGQLLSVFPLLEEWMRDVQSYALAIAEGGTEVPGFKLVERGTKRKFENPVEAAETLTPLLGDDAFNKKLKGITELSKLLKPLNKVDVLNSLLVKPKGGNTLAPIDSAKPETQLQVEKDFAGISF